MKSPIQIATEALAVIATFGYDDIHYGIERVQQIASNALDEICLAPPQYDAATKQTRARISACHDALRIRLDRVKKQEDAAIKRWAILHAENRALKDTVTELSQRLVEAKANQAP